MPRFFNWWHPIISNFDTLIYFRSNDNLQIKWYSQMLIKMIKINFYTQIFSYICSLFRISLNKNNCSKWTIHIFIQYLTTALSTWIAQKRKRNAAKNIRRKESSIAGTALNSRLNRLVTPPPFIFYTSSNFLG